MNELRLIGYTADLGHLVLVDEEGADPERYRLVIEPDLFATLDEVRRKRRAAELPVGDMVEFADRFGIDAAALQRALRGGAGTPIEQPDRPGSTDEAEREHGEGQTPGSDEATPAGPAGDEQATSGAEVDDGEVTTEEEGPGIRILDPDEATRRRREARESDGADDPWEEQPGGAGEEGPLFDQQAWSAWSLPEPRAPLERPAPDRDDRSEGTDGVGDGPGEGAARGPEEPIGHAGAGATEGGEEPVGPGPAAGSAIESDGPGGQPPPVTGEEVVLEEPEPEPEPEPESVPDSPPVAAPISDLPPAEIQSRLRAGHSVEEVAQAAGTDRSWIERWLVPIEAERTRILGEALARRMQHSDLGLSEAPLGDAVEQNLTHVEVDPESIRWEVARPSRGTWRVLVRYVQGERERQATWLYDPVEESLTPASPEAREVGFTRHGAAD